MLDVRNPEIDIDDLMRRINEEMRRRVHETGGTASIDAAVRSMGMTGSGNGGDPAQQQPTGVMGPLRDAVSRTVTRAQQFVAVGTALPEMSRMTGWKRRVAVPAAKVILRVAQIITRDQRSFNQAIVDSVRSLDLGLQAMRTAIDALEGRWRSQLAQIEARVEAFQKEVGLRDEAEKLRASWVEWQQATNERLERTLEAQVQSESRVKEVSARAERIAASLDDVARDVAGIVPRVDDVARLGEDVARLGTDVEGRLKEIENLSAERDRVGAERVGAVSQQLEPMKAALEVQVRTTSDLGVTLVQQERRFALHLEEACRRLPSPFDRDQLETFAREMDHVLDPLYVAFTDHFRGTREDIMGRARAFLGQVRASGAGTTDRPILDIGCGRGEWLELLKAEGLVGRGIEINRIFNEHCRARGLDVVLESAQDHLRCLPDSSIGAVTGFHVIEHVPFPVVVRLLDETMRVLKPGGIALFETPNPENLLVGATNFCVDPTHGNPLHPETMRFVLEARGFVRVEVRPVHPYPESAWLPDDGNPVTRRLNDLLFGPQDYAVLGYRP